MLRTGHREVIGNDIPLWERYRFVKTRHIDAIKYRGKILQGEGGKGGIAVVITEHTADVETGAPLFEALIPAEAVQTKINGASQGLARLEFLQDPRSIDEAIAHLEQFVYKQSLQSLL